MLDERLIRVDVDYGFEEGRQFGRGRSGGQVRRARPSAPRGRGAAARPAAAARPLPRARPSNALPPPRFMPQVRDEFRTDYDSARGGFGKQLVAQINAQGLAVRETEAGQVKFVPLQQVAAQRQQAAGEGPADGAQQQQAADAEARPDGGDEDAAATEAGAASGGQERDTPAPKRRRVGGGGSGSGDEEAMDAD
jgi:nuclear cap-binding protein subunit 2